MQGEISHWRPLTDGGLTARCNTDPREYQVSPHYTLHGLFQLPMLPSLIGITETTPKHPKDIAFLEHTFYQKAFNLNFPTTP